MEPINLTTTAYYLYALLINAGLGALFGFIPLVTGFVKRQRKYAFWGFILSVVGGTILGLGLAVPISLVMTWLIVTRWSKPDSPQTS